MRILTAASVMYVIVAPSWWPLAATLVACVGIWYALSGD